MRIGTDTHSRKHTAHVRVLDKADGKVIDWVIGLDTETGILKRIDPHTKAAYTERRDFTVVDGRTGLPLTPEQIADIENGATARSAQLVDELLNDLTARDNYARNNFDFDKEVRASITADWVKIVERWR